MFKKLNDLGVKDKQREDNIDHSIPFKSWHRLLGREYYAQDVDLIDYRYYRGRIRYAAVMELTKCFKEEGPDQDYLDSLLARWKDRDGQAKVMIDISSRLGAPLYVVLFTVKEGQPDRFWILSVEKLKWWNSVSSDRVANWIKNL
jgi:hypothetical protein